MPKDLHGEWVLEVLLLYNYIYADKINTGEMQKLHRQWALIRGGQH